MIKDTGALYPLPHCPECLSSSVRDRLSFWKRLKRRLLCCIPRAAGPPQETMVWTCNNCRYHFGPASEGASSATLTVFEPYMSESSLGIMRTGWTPRPDILRMLPKGWCADCDLFVHKDEDKQCLNCGGSRFDVQSQLACKEMSS